MTATPFDAALASIAAPLPESSASTSSTLAPLVMAASAWVCIVLRAALRVVDLEVARVARRPRSLSRYGRSNDS